MTPDEAYEHIETVMPIATDDDRYAMEVLDRCVTVALMQLHLQEAMHVSPRTDDSMRRIKHYLAQLPCALDRLKEAL